MNQIDPFNVDSKCPYQNLLPTKKHALLPQMSKIGWVLGEGPIFEYFLRTKWMPDYSQSAPFIVERHRSLIGSNIAPKRKADEEV